MGAQADGQSRNRARAARGEWRRAGVAAAVAAGLAAASAAEPQTAAASDEQPRQPGAAALAPAYPGQKAPLAPPPRATRDSVAPFAPHVAPAPNLRARLGVGRAGAPAIWRVRGPKGAVWIFGSVHALPEGADWRRPALMRALARADVVYFETPINAKAGREMTATALQNAYLPQGQSLGDLLSEEGRALFQAWIDEAPQLRRQFERLRPWAAAFSLGAGEVGGGTDNAPGLWMDSRRGVDPQLALIAAQSGKELRYFKSASDQIRVLSDMPEADQIELLEASLSTAEDAELTSALVGSWLTGDVEGLEKLVFEGPHRLPRGAEEALLDKRNIDWARDIDAFLKEGGDALVIGGAAHFVGPGNVLELLVGKGWTVERF